MPQRIQRRRTKGWRIPEGAVYVGRPTKWGNPFRVGKEIPFLPGRKVQDNLHAVSLFVGSAPQNEQLVAAAKAELKGKNLVCWCSLRVPCHADVLLKIANAEIYDGRRDGPIHGWFGLTYAHYLVLPRSLMSVMPIEWQERMTNCLEEMYRACEHLNVKDKYTVLLRGEKGRIVKDPYADYRHSNVPNLEIPNAAD